MFLSLLLGGSSMLAPLADVRVGEQGDRVRVEVLCSRSCDVELRDETSFFVTWATADFTASLREQTSLIEDIQLRTVAYGTELTFRQVTPARSIVAKRCGVARVCFDLAFGDDPVDTPAPITMSALESDLSELMVRTGYTAPSVTTPDAEEPVAEAPRDAAIPEKRTACDAAQALLDEDAWNLAAFETVKLCKAAASRQTMRRSDAIRLVDSGFSVESSALR